MLLHNDTKILHVLMTAHSQRNTVESVFQYVNGKKLYKLHNHSLTAFKIAQGKATHTALYQMFSLRDTDKNCVEKSFSHRYFIIHI